MSGWKKNFWGLVPMWHVLPLEIFRSFAQSCLMTEKLKLIARSADDLSVISAVLQDSVLRIDDMAWLPEAHRFAVVANRFRWEKVAKDAPRRKARGERVRAGLHFDGILRAQFRNLSLGDKQKVVELLAINTKMGEDGAATIELVFAGGGTIRLEAECIEVVLQDLSNAWAALRTPSHAVD